MARAVAVAKQLEALDDQVMRDVLQFHPRNLVVYSEDQLLQAKDSFENRKQILFPHMACLAAYLDQPAEFRFHADTVQSRLVHLASNNSVEMLRDWVIMATMAQSAGIDIWTFQGQALCGHVAAFVRCCGPTAATCNATIEDTSLRLQYGWDLVPLVLPKCPSLRATAECRAVASAVATQRFGNMTSIRNAHNWHFPPYMSLWQT
ncbi:hypothetical protein DYB35_013434 [Aphanomyces astaci]|uniref:Uncharacterized protein n=1 Tax=Aphanomyces astaci TaxID=112090 RepID=A0A3R7ACV6_APHAT|nr:hypothetical protein DYB35_013434 [Aphanomyces astaci]